MKLKYLNFVIEEDRNWFILSEVWIIPEINKISWKKNKNAWDTSILDQTYPSTLLRCFEKISHKIKKDNKKEYNSLQEYIEEIKTINDNLIKDLNLITNK